MASVSSISAPGFEKDVDPFDLVGDVIDSQFRVDEVAGEGELSVVYRGRHLGVDAPVAIKCLNLPSTLDARLLQPLVDSLREGARIHYKLAQGHLFIAQTIACGTTIAPRSGSVIPYLVREWIEGRSLAGDFESRARLQLGARTIGETVELLDSAADALAFAHAQGVVHHWVNPRNMFVVDGPRPLVKVLDFGVAKVLNEHTVTGGAGVGLRVLLPTYAAPEQLDHAIGPTGAPTDVYAFALIVYESLIGRPLLAPSTTPGDVLKWIVREERPRARALGVVLSDEVEAVLARALSVAPGARHANLRELWDDLKTAARVAVRKPPPLPVRAPSAPSSPAITAKAAPPTPPRAASKPPAAPRIDASAAPSPREDARSEAKREERAIEPIVLDLPRREEPKVTAVAPSAPRPVKALSGPTPLAFPPPPPARAEPEVPPLPPDAIITVPPRAMIEVKPAADGAPEPAPVPAPPPSVPRAALDPASVTHQVAPAVTLGTDPLPFPPLPIAAPNGAPGRSPVSALTPFDASHFPELAAAMPERPRWTARAAAGAVGAAALVIALVGLTRHARAPVDARARATASATDVTSATTRAASAPKALAANTEARGVIARASSASAAPAPRDAPLAARAADPGVFSRDAERAALDEAAADLPACARKGGPRGPGSIRVRVDPSGKIARIQIGPPYAGTSVGKCIVERFQRAEIAPFHGPPQAMNYVFTSVEF